MITLKKLNNIGPGLYLKMSGRHHLYVQDYPRGTAYVIVDTVRQLQILRHYIPFEESARPFNKFGRPATDFLLDLIPGPNYFQL